MDQRVYIDGELYLSLDLVAELYRVQPLVLRSACEQGLIAPIAPHGASVCIAAFRLDRVATIVRLHVGLGLDLRRIAEHLAACGDEG
ncbi:MAG: hypothetical protein JNN27_12090 [Planctomycetes bacterium]|nr:hypothetical protein [Planctomycetota bacterium]